MTESDETARSNVVCDVGTSERLATTGRAVAQRVGHMLKGEHETEPAATRGSGLYGQ